MILGGGISWLIIIFLHHGGVEADLIESDLVVTQVRRWLPVSSQINFRGPTLGCKDNLLGCVAGLEVEVQPGTLSLVSLQGAENESAAVDHGLDVYFVTIAFRTERSVGHVQ